MKLVTKREIQRQTCYDISIKENHNFFANSVCVHNSNGSVVRPVNGTVDDIYFQSRERIISLESDNAGFAVWCTANKDHLNKIFNSIAVMYLGHPDLNIQIYGEWCGGNIQKKVGVCNLPKMFVVFGIRVSKDAASTDWFDEETLKVIMDPFVSPDRKLFHIYQFPTYRITIDPLKPEIAQNKLVDLTLQIEQQCPVAAALLPIPYPDCMIGEGIVWTCVSKHPVIDLRGVTFKTKGEKHSSTKNKTIVPIDEEAVNSVREFVDATVTQSRLEQGLAKLTEMGLDNEDVKHIGEYLRWVTMDVFKEESAMIVENNLNEKNVKSEIAKKARTFFLNRT